MTTINVIHVRFMTDEHLRTEYLGLPKIVDALTSGAISPDYIKPAGYSTGSTNNRFFYNKIEFLAQRMLAIVEELSVRGYLVEFDTGVVASWVSAVEACGFIQWPYEYRPYNADRTTCFYRLHQLESAKRKPSKYHRIEIAPDHYLRVKRDIIR